MSGLIFEEPPRSRGRGSTGEVAALLAPLRGRPGEWARLPGDYAATFATEVKRGRHHGIREGEFDAVTRKQDPPHPKGRVSVWVRYVGGEPV